MRNLLLFNHPHHHHHHHHLSSIIPLLLFLSVTFATTTEEQTRNTPPNDNAPTTTTIISSTSELPYDENGKLARHILVYPESNSYSNCRHLITKGVDISYDAHQLIGVKGDAMRDFFPNHISSSIEITNLQDCPSICLERGMDRKLVTFPMKDRVYFDSDKSDYVDWFDDCSYVEVGFINYFNEDWPLEYYWITAEDEEYHGEIEYGRDNIEQFSSSIGSEFRFYDSETSSLVYSFVVEFHSTVAIGNAPPHGSYDGDDDDFIAEIQEILNEEWDRQGNVKRTFSTLGFKKSRLPDDLFGAMSAFHYNNRHNHFREDWYDNGLYVNWWETDVEMIDTPDALVESWGDGLKSLVDEWVNNDDNDDVVPLEETVIYGMRRYSEGARLLTHVDRNDTHAASLIVNVAQGNVTERWPIEIYDHAGRLHQVTMAPGDILYYESAACLHGRSVPLRGEGSYYVNLFAHYRPMGDARWLERDNPPGTPEPLMDVGECRLLEGDDESSVRRDDLGVVGRVKCDDPEIGPYLSPSLFTARSGEDLFNWWRDVGPKEISEQNFMSNELLSDEL